MRKINAFFVIALICGSIGAGEIIAVEKSKCFRKYIEPTTKVVSYILDAPRVALHQQSIYFTHKSMTDDGRFLIFHGSDEKMKTARRLYVLDLKSEKITKVTDYKTIPFLDVKTSQVYYIRKEGLFRHDLKKDPAKAIKLVNFPAELQKIGRIEYICTHLTLTRDRSKAFLDMKIGGRYIQGMLDIKTGNFTKWGEADFFVNHGQIHPFRDDIALCAWENLNKKEIKGVYPRMWLFEPGNKRTMIPSRRTNYATHEHWAEDGKGFYFCSSGVYYHELESGRQYNICPMRAAHAAMTADNKYLTFDTSAGMWYRGCSWQIGFYNRETGKGLYFYPELAAYNTIENPSRLHPDPHPQFVCGGKYIISTVNLGSGYMDLSITPVDQLIKLTSK